MIPSPAVTGSTFSFRGSTAVFEVQQQFSRFNSSFRGSTAGFSRFNLHLSNEQNPSCLGYIGDYATQIYGDYKPL